MQNWPMSRRCSPLRLALLLAGLVLGAATLSACDTEVTLRPRSEASGSEVAGRVDALEAAVARERARADRLEQELSVTREESVVLRTDDGWKVRLNTQAAVVLVVAILGLVTVLVARLKFPPKARHGNDGEDRGA